MTQQECFQTASHFTHLGVCYPGGNAYIGISSPQNPQPVKFTVVPEPDSVLLLLTALAAMWVARRFRHA